MIFLELMMLFVCIAMPLGLAWRIWRLAGATRAGWLILVAETLAFFLLILMIGRWDIAGYYTRFAVIAVMVLALVLSWRRNAASGWAGRFGKSWKAQWPSLISLAFFGSAAVYVALGFLPGEDVRQMAFPLRGGNFVVGQGGGNALLNYHSSHRAQRFAADFTALNGFGFRADGIALDDPTRYAVYGSTVVSPCDGKVVSLRDGLPDQRPPKRDRENATGNHVVLDCEGVRVELAHFQPGSIVVAAGDAVAARQKIALVGNSGNTTEPHLHIHAIDPESGEGVRIAFDGRVPVRNRTFAN